LGGGDAFASLPGIFGSAGGYCQVDAVVILCGDVMENLAVGSGVLFWVFTFPESARSVFDLDIEIFWPKNFAKNRIRI